MFNTLCWGLNVVGLSRLAAWLRRAVLRLMAARARVWSYDTPQAGWWGGVDVPLFGTVAFIADGESAPHVPYSYEW